MKPWNCNGSDALLYFWDGIDISPGVYLPGVARQLQKVLIVWRNGLGTVSDPREQAGILVIASYNVRGPDAPPARLCSLPGHGPTGLRLQAIYQGPWPEGNGTLLVDTAHDTLQVVGGYGLNVEADFNLQPYREICLSEALKAKQVVWPGEESAKKTGAKSNFQKRADKRKAS